MDRALAVWSALVLASMLALFLVPTSWFVGATFAATACMLLAGWRLGAFASRGPLRPRALAAGLASAAALYLVFLAGNAGVTALHPFGVGAASEQSIYSLIASPSNPIALQAAVLLFDSAGYEGFFRGALMSRAEPRLGAWAPAGVAAADACMHLATLNPLWVATTFVADLCWGETCRRGGGLQASFVSHLAWDLLIFVVAPIR